MRNSILWSARRIGIVLGHAALHFHRAAHRIDGAGELDQHAVAAGLDDAAAVRRQWGIDDGFLDILQPGQRAFLISAHQPAIAGDFRRQHRRQSSLYALAVQKMPRKYLEISSEYESTPGVPSPEA